jgi:hypothetical protein
MHPLFETLGRQKRLLIYSKMLSSSEPELEIFRQETEEGIRKLLQKAREDIGELLEDCERQKFRKCPLDILSQNGVQFLMKDEQ